MQKLSTEPSQKTKMTKKQLKKNNKKCCGSDSSSTDSSWSSSSSSCSSSSSSSSGCSGCSSSVSCESFRYCKYNYTRVTFTTFNVQGSFLNRTFTVDNQTKENIIVETRGVSGTNNTYSIALDFRNVNVMDPKFKPWYNIAFANTSDSNNYSFTLLFNTNSGTNINKSISVAWAGSLSNPSYVTAHVAGLILNANKSAPYFQTALFQKNNP